jgi:DNA mismatch endonuclease (patch repair protein)
MNKTSKFADRLLPRRKRAALTRSQMMARIASKDTNPEVRTRSALTGFGLHFRKHAKDLPGSPDIVNRRNRWVIFVHGCFWHSHSGCSLASTPRTNSEYWTPKLRRNADRDRQKAIELRRLGYRVFVVWECETRNPKKLNAKLESFLPRLRLLSAVRLRR